MNSGTGLLLAHSACGRPFSLSVLARKFSWVIGTCWNTEFRLSPIPLGGYVSIPELGDETNVKDAFDVRGNKREPLNFAIWKRTCVACAGVAMNIIFPIVLIFGLYVFKGQPELHMAGLYVSGLSNQVTIAKDAGLKEHDELLSVNGKAVDSERTLTEELKSHVRRPVALRIHRDSSDLDIAVVPNQHGLIGIHMMMIQNYKFIPMGVNEAVIRSFTIVGQNLGAIAYGIAGMIHLVPNNSGAELHSVVGIVSFGAKLLGVGGTVVFIYLLIFISLNLAVFNMLPVPMLDGGHVVFLSIEKLRGKPLSPKTQGRIKLIFAFLLLLVLACGVVNDFVHPLVK